LQAPDTRRTILEVWFADYPFTTYDGQEFLAPLRRRAEEFERAHPGYRVNVRGVPFWTMAQEVAAAAADGRAPHIAGFYAADSQTARDLRAADGTPLFTSVEAAVAGRGEILGEPVVLDDLAATVRASYTVDGELFSLPATVTTMLLYANTTLLQAAGVREVPRTWEELEQACAAVARMEGGPGHGISWANDGFVFEQAVAQQGGLLADRDNGRSGRGRTVDLASPQMLAWVRWWAGMKERGHYLYTGEPSDWGGAFGAFAEGRVAFTLDSSKAAEDLVRCGAEAGFTVVACPVPRNSRARYAGHPVSGDSLWLAAGLSPKEQDGALALMQYVINAENAADWHRSNGFVPVTETAFGLLEEAGWFGARPHQRVASEQLDASDRSPAALGARLGDFAGIHEVMARAMHEVLEHGADPAAAFAEATAKAQELLDAYHARIGESREVEGGVSRAA
jgi:sn-glycerol 3-phosphate transport system substrate-binding protein